MYQAVVPRVIRTIRWYAQAVCPDLKTPTEPASSAQQTAKLALKVFAHSALPDLSSFKTRQEGTHAKGNVFCHASHVLMASVYNAQQTTP